MGYGNYSASAHEALTQARSGLSHAQVFGQSTCHPLMNPKGVKLRESRDSESHPNSVGVIFALDVSSSMGDIPHLLATKTLPTFMQTVLGVLPDAQVLFMALGNAFADRSPLQVGQFESEAPLMDQWLSMIHLESGGGGLGESYDLALYFASRHTAMDCLIKREKKGYFFMTGDEPGFSTLEPRTVLSVIGDVIPERILGHDVVAEMNKSFHGFFLVPDPTRTQQSAVWRGWLHERCVVLDRAEDAAIVAAILIAIEERIAVDEAAIHTFTLERVDGDAAIAERVTRTVLPFALALAKGPIAGPDALPEAKPGPFKG